MCLYFENPQKISVVVILMMKWKLLPTFTNEVIHIFTFLAKCKSHASLSVFGRQYLSRSYYFFATCSVSESERYDHSVTNSIYKNPMWPSFLYFFWSCLLFHQIWQFLISKRTRKKCLPHIFFSSYPVLPTLPLGCSLLNN